MTGQLSHSGITYSLFNNIPSASSISISPINSFIGSPQGGNWTFTFDTDTTMRVHSWGIIENIPEPSIFSLVVVGGVMLYSTRLKYEKNSL